MIHVRLGVASPALRAGLTAFITEADDIQVVVDGDPATPPPGTPTVLILTSTAEDGEAAWDSLTGPKWSVLLLSDKPVELGTLRPSTGGRGILPFDASPEELRAAIRAVAAGLVVGTGSLLLAGDEKPTETGPLTEREVQVLGLLATGLANKQIALELSISEHTVKFHVSSIYAKLNAANRTQAVREGLRRGWIAL